MPVNQNPASPLLRTGSEVTDDTGLITFQTELLNRVEHLSITITATEDDTVARILWAASETVPGEVSVEFQQADGTPATETVSFTWAATGF